MARPLLLFTIIIGVLFGFSLFILWLVAITHKVKFHVAGADLTQFNLTDDDQLLYNLDLNITAGNPSQRFGINFDNIQVAVLYHDIEFGNTTLAPFYQGQDGTRLLRMKFDGQRPVKLDAVRLAVFTLEQIAEIFSIQVELRLKIRVNVAVVKIKLNPKVDCGFNVPLLSRRRSSFLRFRIIGCRVRY
ncbi:NDR1/HIN1-like protein 3 [Momordica charantia]|uniref:NDR1/HIN1-like protein 3 n=1 Tax=Momordica charantia TaxID=3673 RepID=A0A6J1CU57_MOMCH|nr:NDR1/HIN1-like protein 3 [Momordica charantia]